MADVKDQKLLPIDVDFLFERKDRWRETFAELGQQIKSNKTIRQMMQVVKYPGNELIFYEPLLIVHRYVKVKFLSPDDPDTTVLNCFIQGLKRAIADEKKKPIASSIFSLFASNTSEELKLLEKSSVDVASTDDIADFFHLESIPDPTKMKVSSVMEDCYQAILLNFSAEKQAVIRQKAKDSVNLAVVWRNFIDRLHIVDGLSNKIAADGRFRALLVDYNTIRRNISEAVSDVFYRSFKGCEDRQFTKETKRLTLQTSYREDILANHSSVRSIENCDILSVLCFFSETAMEVIQDNVTAKVIDRFNRNRMILRRPPLTDAFLRSTLGDTIIDRMIKNRKAALKPLKAQDEKKIEPLAMAVAATTVTAATTAALDFGFQVPSAFIAKQPPRKAEPMFGFDLTNWADMPAISGDYGTDMKSGGRERRKIKFPTLHVSLF